MAGIIFQTAQRGEAGSQLFDVQDLIMQTNELHEFAGRGHGDVVGALWGYLGQGTACGGVLLPPLLEGLLPFLGFVTLGFLHRDSSPERLHRPSDTSDEHVATLSRTRRVYLA